MSKSASLTQDSSVHVLLCAQKKQRVEKEKVVQGQPLPCGAFFFLPLLRFWWRREKFFKGFITGGLRYVDDQAISLLVGWVGPLILLTELRQ